MKKTISIISILLLLFTSCTTTSDYNKSFNTYRDLPTYDGIIYGYGFGKSYEAASLSALENISRQVSVKVSFITQSGSTVQSMDGVVTSKQEMNKDSDVESSSELDQAKILDYRVDDQGIYNVLMYYKVKDNSLFSEEEVVQFVRDKQRRNMIFTTSASAALPGSGQFMNGNNTKGFTFVTSSLALLTGGFISMVASSNNYDEYINANNNTEKDYYWEKTSNYNTIGIISFSLYGVICILSAIDNYFSTK